MRVFPSDVYISGVVLAKKHVWEWPQVKLMMQKMASAESGFFLDIGANLGSFSVPIAEFQLSRSSIRERGVISVDPRNKCTDTIVRSALENKGMASLVSVMTAAVVSDRTDYPNGVCTAYDTSKNETNIGGTQTGVGARKNANMDCTDYVPAITLDILMEKNPNMTKVFAVKLDCEGCEGAALYGGSKWLETNPPCHIMFEVTEKYLCDVGTPWKELKAYLVKKGYELTSNLEDFEQGGCDHLEIRQKNVWWAMRDLNACHARFSINNIKRTDAEKAAETKAAAEKKAPYSRFITKTREFFANALHNIKRITHD